MKIPPARIYFPDKDKEEILRKIEECLTTGQLTLGKNGREFEEKFAEYIGIKHAVGVSSGTSAIEIPLRILGIEGKEVLVPTNTFFATAAAVLHAGGRIKFVDADPETFSVDIESVKRNISDATAGLIVVHIGGIVTSNMPQLQEICKSSGLFLFEDAAHAHGSSLDGKMAGTFGDAAAFSFYPTKVVTAGEGGMIVTASDRISDEARLYRDQGKISFTQNLHDKLGSNWRLSEPHAIIGLSQFGRLEEFIADRTKVARIYDRRLKDNNKIRPLHVPDNSRTNYYKYIALLEPGVDRAKLKAHLREKYEVGLSGEVYELPCHLQPIFKRGYKEGDLPKAEDICKRHICLPVYAGMTEEEANYVVDSLGKTLGEI